MRTKASLIPLIRSPNLACMNCELCFLTLWRDTVLSKRHKGVGYCTEAFPHFLMRYYIPISKKKMQTLSRKDSRQVESAVTNARGTMRGSHGLAASNSHKSGEQAQGIEIEITLRQNGFNILFQSCVIPVVL